MEADGGGLFLFQVVGGLGFGTAAGLCGDEAGVVSKLRRPSAGRGLGGLPRFGVGGMGGSRLPGVRETKFTRGVRRSPGWARARACEGGTEGAGPGLGGTRSFHHTTGRGAMTRSGEGSGEVVSGLRLLPQVQRVMPSSSRAPQTLRARIGLPQRRHMHMQCSAVSPHWRPVP